MDGGMEESGELGGLDVRAVEGVCWLSCHGRRGLLLVKWEDVRCWHPMIF